MNEMAEEPRGDDNNAQTVDLQERMESRRAASRLLEIADDGENKYFAAVAKLESLKTLQAIGVENATVRLDAHLKVMATNTDERLARSRGWPGSSPNSSEPSRAMRPPPSG